MYRRAIGQGLGVDVAGDDAAAAAAARRHGDGRVAGERADVEARAGRGWRPTPASRAAAPRPGRSASPPPGICMVSVGSSAAGASGTGVVWASTYSLDPRATIRSGHPHGLGPDLLAQPEQAGQVVDVGLEVRARWRRPRATPPARRAARPRAGPRPGSAGSCRPPREHARTWSGVADRAARRPLAGQLVASPAHALGELGRLLVEQVRRQHLVQHDGAEVEARLSCSTSMKNSASCSGAASSVLTRP